MSDFVWRDKCLKHGCLRCLSLKSSVLKYKANAKTSVTRETLLPEFNPGGRVAVRKYLTGSCLNNPFPSLCITGLPILDILSRR